MRRRGHTGHLDRGDDHTHIPTPSGTDHWVVVELLWADHQREVMDIRVHKVLLETYRKRWGKVGSEIC
jgi:hypothetical protein